MKRFYSALLTLAMLMALSLTASGADGGGVRILVDGAPLNVSGAYINERGTTMAPLRALAEALGCEVRWDAVSQTVSIATGQEAPAPERSALVVLDPGHGGSANGAEYGGVKEKDLNLSIARQAAGLLEEAGVTVLLTRTEDRDMGLYERTDLANGQQADLFVSVHCNASGTVPTYQGIYTYYFPGSGRGEKLARTIQPPLCAITGAIDRGVSKANFVVLRETEMCAVLVETGFMSNVEELTRLCDPAYQEKVAWGIAEGVIQYLNDPYVEPEEPLESPEPQTSPEPQADGPAAES